MRLLPLVLALLWLLPIEGRAAAIEDPNEAEARAHFERGRALYVANDYAAAAREFQAARDAKAHAAFDYNLARCYDRLNQLGPAIDAYERYLGWGPNEPDTPEVRKRIAILRGHRAADRAIWVPASVGGLALVTGVVGAGLLGTAPARYDELSPCSPRCDTGAVDRARAMDYAGKALLGVAGALIVVDIALWATHKHRVRWLRESGEHAHP